MIKNKIVWLAIAIIILFIIILPIRYLTIDFGLENLPKSISALIQIKFTNKDYILIKKNKYDKKIEYIYILKPKGYMDIIHKIMKNYGFIPDDIGTLGTRIPYVNSSTNDRIKVYHGYSGFYGILKFEIKI